MALYEIKASNAKTSNAKTSNRLATLSWDNLNVFARLPPPSIFSRLTRKDKGYAKKKQILFDVSGEAYQGSMLAIMGSSGSGKTTLLNTLAGFQSRKLKLTGKILVNGKTADLKSVSAYVEQNDLFLATLTVKEHLLFNARLILNKTISNRNIESVVDNIIVTFGLDKCKNTQIGGPSIRVGISGGEKRRLSIATKVLSDPKIIFLDEPTSGLDSYMVENVVATLKNMSLKCTVIATIHQPSSQVFEMFDDLYLLAEGNVIFSGKRKSALNFFTQAGMKCPTNYNPADFYIGNIAIKIGSEDECREIINLLKSENMNLRKLKQHTRDFNLESTKEVDCISSRKTLGVLQQFLPLLGRAWVTNIREPFLFKSRIIQTLIIGLIYGLIFLNLSRDLDSIVNYSGALFGLLAQCTFGAVIGVIYVFPQELAVFRREHSSKLYDTSVYFITKTLVDIPIFVLVPTILFIITYWMIGFNPNISAIFIHWAILLLITQVAVAYGYLISSIARDFQMASSLSTPLLMPLLIFGGLFIRSVDIPIYFQWISYISWFKYGFDALCTNLFTGLSLRCIDTTRTCANNQTSIDGVIVLDILGLDNFGISVDVAALFALLVGFRILALLFLILKTKLYER